MYQVQCSCGEVFDAEDDDVPLWRCPRCGEIVEPGGGDSATAVAAGPGAEDDDADGGDGAHAGADEALDLEAAWGDEASVIAALSGVFLHPLRGDGPYILLGGWLLGLLPVSLIVLAIWSGWLLGFFFALSAVLGLAVSIPGAGVMTWIAGYAHLYLASVTEEAAAGRDAPAAWPAAEDVWSTIGAGLSAVIILLAAFVPAAVPLLVAARAAPVLATNPLFVALVVLGLLTAALVLPIVYLSATLRGLPWAFAYGSHVRAILAAPSSYGLCALVCAGVLGLLAASFALLGVHVLLGLLVPAPAVYLATVLARAIGLYYFTTRRRLAWFRVE